MPRGFDRSGAGQPAPPYPELIERLPAAAYVATTDPSAGPLYVSPQIEALLGFSVEEHVADPYLFLSRVHAEDHARVRAEHDRTFAEGVSLDTVYRVVARSGRVVWLHDRAEIRADADGTPLLYGVMVDVSRNAYAGRGRSSERALGRGTVLVADDDGGVRALLVSLLEKQGYTVLAARDGREAASLLAGHPQSIDVLLTDIEMPGIGGPELAERLARERPRARVVFVTASTSPLGDLPIGPPVLRKPFAAGALARAVRDALEGRPGA